MPSMLTIFRLHVKTCAHRGKGRLWRRCKCPIHTQGTVEGNPYRESLGTNNWSRATEIVREWEATGRKPAPAVTAENLRDEFTADLIRLKRADATKKKYAVLFKRLVKWAEAAKITNIGDITIPRLRKHIQEWPDGGIAQVKNLERLRCVFGFAETSGWIKSNPASSIKMPKLKPNPTLPFEHGEMAEIIGACDNYPSRKVHRGVPVRARIKALVLLMRYSGLRISDAVSCNISRLTDGELFLYTQKTGTPVCVPLPPWACEELAACPRSNPNYWFWSGRGTVESCRKYWDKKLRKLFELAEVDDGHSHRFRDTFAVEQLNAGTDMNEVSVLLGHASVRITEKHYAPWVASRQERLRKAVEKSWANDPLMRSREKVVEMRRMG